MQRWVSSIAGFALVFFGGGPLGAVAFAQDGSPRLPVGLTLLGADDAPCDGDLMLESGIGGGEGLHRVREGQHAVFEVESPNVGWMCVDDESSSDTMECPEETTHVRILRAADDPAVLFECYGVSTRP